MPSFFWEIISVCWLVFGVYWAIRGIPRRRSKRKAALSFTLLNNGVLYFGLILVWLGRSVPIPLNFILIPQAIALQFTGLVFTIIGVGFSIWSRQFLSNNWNHDVAIMEKQRFIHSGPYAIVRHPIYTGILFALLGTTLVASTLGSLIGFIFAIVSFWQKAQKEEKFLITEFGQQYTNYQVEVKFLIPFIY